MSIIYYYILFHRSFLTRIVVIVLRSSLRSAKAASWGKCANQALRLPQAGVDIEDGDPPEEPEEGTYPRTDSTYSIDIPNSAILWEADPRPENSPQVRAGH